MIVSFLLNGVETSPNVPPHKRLSSVLQGLEGIRSIRYNCQEGMCGACLALLDGAPVSTCLIPAFSVRGRSVLTAEGLENEPDFQCVEHAFHSTGVQLCPYCAPSRMLSVVALIRSNRRPEEREVIDTLSIVRCRCSGFDALKRAVFLAASLKRSEQYG